MSITRIVTNPEAMQASMNLAKLQVSMSKTMAQLASGLSISSASDNPGAVGLIQQFQKQYNTQGDMISNAQNALGMMQTMDGALAEIGNRLQDLNDLAVQASDATLSGAQRAALYQSFKAIRDNILTFTKTVTFNDKPILYGSAMISATLGLGVTFTFNVTKNLSINNTSAFGMALSQKTGWTSTVTSSLRAVSALKSAVNGFGKYRSIIGAQTQAIEKVISSMQNVQTNMSSALSRVKDVDMASAISTYTRQQILASAATAMIAQANSQPQGVLQLLQNI
jgi:flagellin